VISAQPDKVDLTRNTCSAHELWDHEKIYDFLPFFFKSIQNCRCSSPDSICWRAWININFHKKKKAFESYLK